MTNMTLIITILILSVIGIILVISVNGSTRKKKAPVIKKDLKGPVYKNYKLSDYRDSTDLYDAKPKEKITGGVAKNRKIWEGKSTSEPIDQSKYSRETGGAAKNKKPWEK